MAARPTRGRVRGSGGHIRIGASVPFDVVHEAGAYICNWSGHLLRVPADVPDPPRSALFNLIGREPLLATKISDNPCVTVTQARRLAAQLALKANF